MTDELDRGDEPRSSSELVPSEPRGSSLRSVVPFLVFLLFLGLWTWKLLEPNPVPEAIGEAITTDLKFIVSKIAHACGYAFLTLLAAWLPLNRKQFWFVVAFLACHGIATEVLQYVLAWGRTGKVTDVLIDWGGISLGLLAIRLFSRTRPRFGESLRE